MGNKEKDKEQTSKGALGGDNTQSPQDACHANRDLSHERDATLTKQIVETIAREMAKAHTHYQALFNERSTTAMPTSLKITSRAAGFQVMTPFNWTKDKTIYQRWQMWSEKARHALEAMEGDSEKTKISYFHHWVDNERMAQIESWKNSKTLIGQEDYEKLEETQREGKFFLDRIESYLTLFEQLLAPK